jgi:hypothetical protein
LPVFQETFSSIQKLQSGNVYLTLLLSPVYGGMHTPLNCIQEPKSIIALPRCQMSGSSPQVLLPKKIFSLTFISLSYASSGSLHVSYFRIRHAESPSHGEERTLKKIFPERFSVKSNKITLRQ